MTTKEITFFENEPILEALRNDMLDLEAVHCDYFNKRVSNLERILALEKFKRKWFKTYLTDEIERARKK